MRLSSKYGLRGDDAKHQGTTIHGQHVTVQVRYSANTALCKYGTVQVRYSASTVQCKYGTVQIQYRGPNDVKPDCTFMIGELSTAILLRCDELY